MRILKKKDARDAIETNIPGFSLGIKKRNYILNNKEKKKLKIEKEN